MPLSFFKKKSKNKFLTATINAKNIKVLAFYYNPHEENEKYSIIGWGIEPLETDDVRSGIVINPQSVSFKLNETILKATREQEEKIDKIIFGIGDDLALPITTTGRLNRTVKYTVNENDLEELNEKILENSAAQIYNEYFLVTGNEDEELIATTSDVIYSKVDGKKLGTAADMSESSLEAERVEQAVFTSFTPAFHLNALSRLSKETKTKIVTATSNQFAVLNSLKKTDLPSKDLILIGIEEDYTDVSVIFSGGIVAEKTLPIGNKHFSEEVSMKMGLTKHESEKMLLSYAQSDLKETETNLVRKCLDEVLEIWIDGIAVLFNEFTGVRTFPSSILIYGEGANIPDIYEILKTHGWMKSIPFKKHPDFRKLNASDLTHAKDSTGKIVSTNWVANLSLSSIYEEFLND